MPIPTGRLAGSFDLAMVDSFFFDSMVSRGDGVVSIAETAPVRDCARTGVPAIDAIRFSPLPQIRRIHHAPGRLLSFRVERSRERRSPITLDRSAGPDTFLIFWGRGSPLYGKIDYERRVAQPSTKPMYAFLPAGVPAQVTFDADCLVMGLAFNNEYFGELASKNGTSQFEPVMFKRGTHVASLAQMIDQELSRTRRADQFTLDQICSAFQALALQGQSHDLPPFSRSPGFSQPEMDALHEVMRKSIGGKLKLEELAATTGLAVHQFSRKFLRTTGITPHRYLQYKRVQELIPLIIDGHSSLNELARHFGLWNASHMDSVFRSMIGITPSTIRREGMSVQELQEIVAQKVAAEQCSG